MHPVGSDLDVTIAKLTPAQRRAVLAGKVGNGFQRGPGYWPLRNALLDKKLFTLGGFKLVLTERGRQVQAVLLAGDRARPHDTIADSDGDDGA